MGIVISALSFVLQAVSTLDLSVFTPVGFYQPKTPKALIK